MIVEKKGWFSTCLSYNDFDFDEISLPEEFKEYFVPQKNILIYGGMKYT